MTREELAQINEGSSVGGMENGAGTPWRALLRSRNLYAICAMYFAFGYGLYFYFTWLPTYLNQERGFSWEAMGWISSLPFILGFVFKLAAGVIIDRTGRNAPVMALSALLCAAGVYLGVTLEDNYTAAIVIAFGIGAASAQIPGIFTLLQRLVPKAAMSSAAGTMNGIAVGFGALSPVLIGLSISVTGNFGSALYFIMAIVLSGGALATILSAQKL